MTWTRYVLVSLGLVAAALMVEFANLLVLPTEIGVVGHWSFIDWIRSLC